MNVDRIVLAVAGLFVVLSSTLAYYHHIYWLFFNALVYGVCRLESAAIRVYRLVPDGHYPEKARQTIWPGI